MMLPNSLQAMLLSTIFLPTITKTFHNQSIGSGNKSSGTPNTKKSGQCNTSGWKRYRHKIKDNDELADGYNFNWRARYNFLLQAPLSKKGIVPHTFSFIINDEVHLNFGEKVVYNTFDQNRFFIGLSYQTNNSDQLQFGYMNVFQQLSTGNQYRSINAARIFYFHNLDLRKKKS
jgi:hypothetical protein